MGGGTFQSTGTRHDDNHYSRLSPWPERHCVGEMRPLLPHPCLDGASRGCRLGEIAYLHGTSWSHSDFSSSLSSRLHECAYFQLRCENAHLSRGLCKEPPSPESCFLDAVLYLLDTTMNQNKAK